MKRTMILAALVLAATTVFGETVSQPAFRLLDGYLEKRAIAAEYGAKAGPWFLIGSGTTLGAAAATVWFAGDAIADGAGVNRMSREVKFGTTLGLGVGAVVLTGIGLALQQFPPKYDERAQYSAIYHESDPVMQESMAAARLQSLSENAKDSRVVSGWVNLSVVGLSFALQAADNQQRHRPWANGMADPWGWQVGSIVGGVSSILVKSEEEQLYEEYQAVVARLTKD